MIFTFSGAQNTGKTTLLKHLMRLNGGNFIFVPEVTRLVKRIYDLPINEDGGDLSQIMICAEHAKNVFLKDHQENHVILDRCSLDGFVYAKWLYHHNKIDIDTLNFATNIYHKTANKYDIVFYTSHKNIALENDGERSVDEDFRNEIIDIFQLELASFPGKVVELVGNIEERLKTIQENIQQCNIAIRI